MTCSPSTSTWSRAGYDTTTIVVVINTATLKSVTPAAPGSVQLGDSVIDVEA
ncbi:MAG: hypothetical protein R2719_03760 [Micropruina sp.]